MLVINVANSLLHGLEAGPNPWDAPTLEWSTSSPPPSYNFEVIPSIASRHPLWEDRLPQEAHGRSVIERGVVLDDRHETLGVTSIDAEPEIIFKMPSESYMPFAMMLCLSALFAALLAHLWGLAAAAAGLGVIVAIAWLWPRAEAGEKALAAL